MYTRFTVLFLLFLPAVAGCIVTDEIEFEDKINMPPEVTFISPSNELIEPVCQDQVRFYQLQVWDPDDEDGYTSYDAELYLNTKPYSNDWDNNWNESPGTCRLEPIDNTTQNHEESGSYIAINCDLELDYNLLRDVNPGDSMMMKILVSDRRSIGIQQHVPEGARTVEISWILELLSGQECQE